MNTQHGAEDGCEIVVAIREGHALRKALDGEIEKLLDNLIADGTFLRSERAANESAGAECFRGIVGSDRVDEKIGVEKESFGQISARSFLRG